MSAERDFAVVVRDCTGWAQALNLTTGSRQAAQVQRTFEVAQMFTVSLDLAIVGRISVTCQATVTWTVNGVPVRRTFDVSPGVSISGVAEAITVSVQDTTLSPPAIGQSYGVSVLIAAGIRPGSAVPVVQSGRQAAIGAGASSSPVAVPLGARSIAVVGWAASGTPNLELLEQTFEDVTLMDTQIASGVFVPLVAGAGQIVVKNNGAFLTQTLLLWGMDG